MDICNLDWQLIVKFLPSLITGGVSQLPSIVLSQAGLFIRDIERYKKGEKAINSKYFSIIDSSDALTLTELLLNYAMYKKSIDKGWFNKYKKF